MSAHVVADGATCHEVLDAVRAHVTGIFETSDVTIQVEHKGCAERETHL